MSVVAHPEWASGAHRYQTLYKLLTGLSQARSLEGVYDVALDNLLEATAADRDAILLFDDDGIIRFKASRNLSPEYQAAVTGHSPWPQGARGVEPVVVPDVFLDGRLSEFRQDFLREGIRALVFIPLALEAGVFGKLMLYYSEPSYHIEDDVEIAVEIAAHVALATEQKRAEAARARTERRLQAILDNSPTVVFLKDSEGRYLLVNRPWEELFHISKADVVGCTDHQIFPEEAANQFRANDSAVLASGRPQMLEEYAPQDDGIHTYISVKFPLVEADGSVTGVCGIATDITERQKSEGTGHRLAAIVESSDDAIIGEDLNGIITSWNSGAERIYGYSAAQTIGQPISMLAAPDRLDEMPEILAKLRRGQHFGHYETRQHRKDGQIIDVSLTISPVHDAKGRITGASKIARDITRFKETERENAVLLGREMQARRTAEELNQIGLSLAGQLDPEKLVQEVTDRATALIAAEFGSFFHNVVNEKGESYMLYTLSGASREAFAGFPMPRDTPLFEPTFRGEEVVRCDDVRQDPRYEKNPPHHGMPEGHLPVCSYLAAPVVSRSGQVLGGLFFGHSSPGKFTAAHEAMVRGIAAQTGIALDNARLFEQVESAKKDLERSNEDLRRVNHDLEVFAYSASHDLQEPLRTIAISAQLLERNRSGHLDGQDAMFLANIQGAAKRMGVLIDDLLAYMNVTKHEYGPGPEVDSSQVLTDVLQALRGQIEEAGAAITYGELPRVAVHYARLAQVFQNLISNAIKYRNQEVPRVHVAAEARDGQCVFSVSDNGIGIEPVFAGQIFGPFKRLHGRDEYPGSGMGLAICQRVVEQYGGRIWLERSEPGRGSTFCFAVPLGPG